MSTFAEIQEAAYSTAREKGWHDRPLLVDGKPDVDRVLRSQALIHSELTEAVEAWRDDRAPLYLGDDGKPEGFLSELADVVIRIADTTRALGLTLDVDMCGGLTLADTDVRLQIATVRELVDRATECVRIGDLDVYGRLLASAAEHVMSIGTANTEPGYGLPMPAAILTKMSYNARRSHRHGGKLA